MAEQNTLDRLFAQSTDAADYSRRYCGYLCQILERIDHETVGKIVDTLLEAERSDKTVYFIGNGGSAATATHFACDLSKGTKNAVNRFKTNALADNLATFTAYANDCGYEHVFAMQLENLMQKDDVLMCISASGNSPNLINAIEYAHKVGGKVVSLLGFDGGKMKGISDIALVVNTPKGEYGPVEDLHMVFDHLITTYVFKKLAERNGR